jgi:hypothetical protein
MFIAQKTCTDTCNCIDVSKNMLNEGSHTEKLHATMIPANDI